MSAALPFALRTRFQALMEEGLSARGAAARLKISASTGIRWARMLREEGDVSALPQGRPTGSGKLDPFATFFEELLAQDGDMTTTELAGALKNAYGVRAHADSIGRFMGKLGYTHKKSRWSRANDIAQR